MKKTIKAAAVLSVGALALTACGGGDSDKDNIAVVGYSVLESANESVFSAFQDTDAGADASFDGPSYGASGDQSRSVADGYHADEVHFSLEPDMTRLVDADLVADDWKDNDTNGICTQSVVVMVVKTGNPENITGWDDLVSGDISVVTPNPASSGSAKWNLLAAYGAQIANGGTEADASAYMTELFANHIAALPDSGRDATTAFTSGTGDVLLSYENEAILARQNDTDFDYVIPDQTLLIENPCAVTTDADDPDLANDFLDFQKSAEGQKLYAETGFRPLVDEGDLEVEGANDPSDPFPTPETLLTMDDDFGGWGEANDKYFADGTGDAPIGIIAKIQADSGS